MKVRINHIKMLNDDPFTVANRIEDSIRKLVHLHKGGFKIDVDMIGMRAEEPVVTLVEQGKRTHVKPVIVISELKPGEHALNYHALAGTGFADNADELIEGA